jgi:hypothetical protein
VKPQHPKVNIVANVISWLLLPHFGVSDVIFEFRVRVQPGGCVSSQQANLAPPQMLVNATAIALFLLTASGLSSRGKTVSQPGGFSKRNSHVQVCHLVLCPTDNAPS